MRSPNYKRANTPIVLFERNETYPKRDGQIAHEARDVSHNQLEYRAMKFSRPKKANAINPIKAEHLRNRVFRSQNKFAAPYAAQDDRCKMGVKKLFETIGFHAVYVGDLSKVKIMNPEKKIYVMSVSKKESLDAVHS